MEGGGYQLIGGWIGQEIAGQLLDCELIEGHVAVERPNDPIAIGPDGPGWVIRIARGIRVASHIQPAPSPMLSIRR